ncbi:YfhO family protein [Streptomyces griseoaurantiacus]|uniref:YfhO family protein n=1 Tax=Streptomyces griseoaurantiacus TaxID=68213 RepID=UPI0037BC46CD
MIGSTSPRERRAAALLAALLTATGLCGGDVLARGFPFGPRTRDVNDLGNQYVPFHAHLWDLLHGRADGGLLVNWQSGYGSSFLPDLGTYLSSPFAPLVALFPRDEIDLAVYVITLLKAACAGAAMAWLLPRLRPGPWWAAGLLGSSYALCGWTLSYASYNPMWLDGLLALPLLCLVGEWAREGRHRVAGVLIVALAWVANFYTAYMATLGAALVLLLRLWTDGSPRRPALATVGRAALTTVLGVGLAAPLVVTVYAGTRHAHPGRAGDFTPVATENLLARLLPTTYSYASPGLYVGVTALVLALALPFHRAVPVRERAGWTVLVLAVVLSLQWTPTHLAWHAFSAPNGSPYRQAFVVCAVLVCAAWHTLAHGLPDRRALGAGGLLLAVLAAWAYRSRLVHPSYALPVLLLAAAGSLTGLALLARHAGGRGAGRADGTATAGAGPAMTGPGPGRGRTALAGLAVVLLLGTQLGEAAATDAVADRLRLGHMDDYAPWGARQEEQAAAVARAEDWPRRRTDPGREQTVSNDPLMVGGQGAQYYSSLTSEVLSRTLTALGGGSTSRGRSVQSLDNPVTDAVFSVGARVHSPPDPHQRANPRDDSPVTVSRRPVPPLVTVRPDKGSATGFGASPYRNQELLLGSRVYTVPRLTLRTDALGPVAVTARCRAGSEAFLWAPHFSGVARLTETATAVPVARYRSDARGKAIAAMQPLGTVPDSGRLDISLAPNRAGATVPDGAVGCLDTARLRTAVDRLTATGAFEVTVSGATVHARLPAGSTGTAVLAAPRIAGWRCATGDGAERPARTYHGLVAAPLDGSATTLTCTFHPPGLRLGSAIGGLALLATTALAVLTAARRRRTPAPSAPPTAAPPRERVTDAR